MSMTALQHALAGVPALRAHAHTLAPLGEGDYASAYSLEPDLTVLVAKHAFAAHCLARVACLSPTLARGAPLAIPNVLRSLEFADTRAVVYQTVPGVPLSRDDLERFGAKQRADAASSLGALIAHLHATPRETALACRVLESDYPFTMLEDSARLGDAATLYREDLERAAAFEPTVSQDVIAHLERRLETFLESGARSPHVLLHNELSNVHVLVNPRHQRLAGVVDLNGMILGPAAREFVYLLEDYGEAFTRAVLAHCPHLEPDATLEETQFYCLWHTLAKLLWALENQYASGVERWLPVLRAQLETQR
jgi:aminoglycoside 2''-phosphotransferase